MTKAAPGLFFGPDAAEGTPAYWKTMQITGIETGSAIYGGGLTKYHDVKPTKAFLVHGCNKKENESEGEYEVVASGFPADIEERKSDAIFVGVPVSL